MIVITAASGHLGQSVADALAKQGVSATTRLAARDTAKLAAQAAQGFQLARIDYDDQASVAAAFAGAETVFLISANGQTADRIRQDKASIDAAKKAAVKRLVYTSFTNPSVASKYVWAQVYVQTEPYLKASGLAYTILRNNPYCTNLGLLLANAKQTGAFVIPGAKGKVAYVGHNDLGAATAAVLVQSGHENRTYSLTGSEAFDGAGVANLLSVALGRTIVSVDAPPQDFAAYLRSVSVPEYIIEGLLTSYAAAEAGEYSQVSDDIGKLSGRPAGSLRDYVRSFGT
jgi:NAD(P)H dehydrogenase (quinone)